MTGRRRHGARRRGSLAAANLAVLALIVVLLFPIYWMLISSLRGESQFSFPPKFFPSHPSATSYAQIFTQKPLGTWLLNSVIVSLVSTVLSIVVSAPAAFILSRFRSVALTSFSIAILVTQMLPATLLIIPMYFLFRTMRLLDSLAGLVLVYTAFAIPLSVWILRGFFDTIPRELEESAKIDGCTELAAFRRITLPLSLPGLAATGVFAFVLAWNDFFFAKTFINSQWKWVVTVGLSSFSGWYALEWQQTMAASAVFALPPAIAFLFVQRYLVGGLTGGAVKG
ncbi:MAG: carbohydrate ABC transporter permease [Armatimonadota bacterium]